MNTKFCYEAEHGLQGKFCQHRSVTDTLVIVYWQFLATTSLHDSRHENKNFRWLNAETIRSEIIIWVVEVQKKGIEVHRKWKTKTLISTFYNLYISCVFKPLFVIVSPALHTIAPSTICTIWVSVWRTNLYQICQLTLIRLLFRIISPMLNNSYWIDTITINCYCSLGIWLANNELKLPPTATPSFTMTVDVSVCVSMYVSTSSEPTYTN